MMQAEIYLEGDFLAEMYLVFRLEKGDKVLLHSRKRCSPGMEPEVVPAVVSDVRYDLGKSRVTIWASLPDSGDIKC